MKIWGIYQVRESNRSNVYYDGSISYILDSLRYNLLYHNAIRCRIEEIDII